MLRIKGLERLPRATPQDLIASPFPTAILCIIIHGFQSSQWPSPPTWPPPSLAQVACPFPGKGSFEARIRPWEEGALSCSLGGFLFRT